MKPENIQIEEQETGGPKLRVLDFGIAKIVRGDQTVTEGLTTPGMVFGTPKYMSPEQVNGASVDIRTDVYAFGLILSEMLVGRHPFGTLSPMAILVAQVNQTPPPIQNLRAGIPEELATLIHRCLAKNPKDRPASMTEVITILESITALPIESQSQPVPVVIDELSDTVAADTSDDETSPKGAVATGQAHITSSRPLGWGIPMILLAILALGVLVGKTLWPQATDAPKTVAQLSVGAESAVRCPTDGSLDYSDLGQPCLDKKTVGLWSFEEDFTGQSLEPRPVVEPLESEKIDGID